MAGTRESEDSGPTDAGQMTGKHAGIWTWLVSMAATTGLICLYARWGWQGVVTGAVLATTVSLFAGLAAWIADGPGKSVRAGRRALTAALLVTASLGLVGVFELAGVCVVLLLAGSAPALTSLVRRQWPGRHPAPAHKVAPDTSGEGQAAQARRRLRAIDDRTLCRGWRDSFALLNDASSMEDRLSVVQLRESYLVRVRSPRIQQPAPLPHRPGQSS
jgi:hypothetical protein